MAFLIQKEYAIIKKHFMIVIYNFGKFLIGFFIATSLLIFTYYFKGVIGNEIVLYFLLPVNCFIMNYSFWKLMQGMIGYYNDLVIFINDKIIIIKSTLIEIDDLEVIEIGKVMKIDVQCHGFFSNLIGYGNLVIELPGASSTQIKILHFIPNPFKALQILREKTSYTNTNQDLNFFKLN